LWEDLASYSWVTIAGRLQVEDFTNATFGGRFYMVDFRLVGL